MLEGMMKIRERIAQIENRFSPKAPESAAFAQYLEAAGKKEKQPPAITHRPPGKARAAHGKNGIKRMLVETAQKYGVDSELVLAVANAESGYRHDAVSSAGAVGVMQLMPGTARSLGVADSFDPKENIDGGVRYLKQMLAMFGGDTAKALAAYNAGPEAVRNYGGIPPYQETQAYVRNILDDIASDG
ncbi:MAG: lytic transglycosylase domain-containing protein [Acidaminococcales bacterium]|jgi:soluble lytic murein transglycosylase-like protein|nr:lytic transglycosylase domain-containing protein [Acidaminococcales bacterium]